MPAFCSWTCNHFLPRLRKPWLCILLCTHTQEECFSRVRLCSDSPPPVVDSCFGSMITAELYSSDRDNFCDAKDCLPLSKCTLQQIADACRISPKSNYSHTCHHLLSQKAPLPNVFLWKNCVLSLLHAGCSLEFDVDVCLESMPCPHAYVYTLSRQSSADALQ